MERNSIQQLINLQPGDRFHYLGNKKKLGTVKEHYYQGDFIKNISQPVKVIVQMDGEKFTSNLKPENEVVYLRS